MVESLSREAARAHIEEIRRGKGLNDGQAQNQNVGDLERALKIVSDELYNKSTHFLLELIQNADDNSYDTSRGTIPTLDVSLYDDYLRVDCNETGFAPRNVEAICKVGNSTKAGVENSTRYVGEKGIGFKSVFKVADVVYINSCDYSFKFEKNGPLGMIAPIWCDFPANTKPGHTTIFMHLAPDCNKGDLHKEILLLDPRMLIFLRKLRQINIQIETARATLFRSLSRLPDVPIRSASVVALQQVTLQQDAEVSKYLVLTHTAKQLPLEPKREGAQESQILLAFPLKENLEPKLEQQQVFAFLPVRDYGLQFLLQADFLLVASREDVDDSSDWNRALRSNAIDAMVEVAKWFNVGGLMMYMWPRFFPGKAKVFGFFEAFKESLLKRIASEKVLKSANGQLMAPSSLMFCLPQFCDKDGRPLTATATSSCRYLSPKYKSDDYETLTTFGVQEMTGRQFVHELSNLVKEDPAFLCHQSLEWHSYLARALYPLCADRELSLEIAALPLISLRDKRWASLEKGNIFFLGDRQGLTIPGGIELLVVENKAAADPFRKLLYQILGVKDLSVPLLCKTIVSTHNDPKFNPRLATHSDLLSQALFLFNAGCIIDKYQKFWCVQECGTLRSLASRLYLESEKPLSASKLLGTEKNGIHFLHRSYVDAASDDQERWHKWLVDSLRVAIYPRLVEFVGDNKDKFRFSVDFEWLLENRPSAEFLVLLRDQWQIYAPYMENDNTKSEIHEINESRKVIRERLSFMGVKTRDGIIRQAKKTYLPTNELVAAAKGCIAFLDVPNPQDKRWELILHSMQVGLKDDLDFYLEALQTLKVRSVTKDVVANFLEQIQARSNSDFPKVRKAFLDNALVYIPSPSLIEPDKWVTLFSCVWDGPKCLRTIYVLKELYPQNDRLFRTILGVEDANIGTLVYEARAITMSSGLDYILGLFLEVEKMLKDNTVVNMPAEARTLQIFPVRNVGSVTGYDSLYSAANEWFIADCSHFHRSFAGKIPLLALDVADISRLKRLLRRAGVEKRRLSIISNGGAQTSGDVSLLDVETRVFRSKVNSILRLIPDNEVNRMKIFQQLREVLVSKASHVIQSWSVTYGNRIIQGGSEDGFVALSSKDLALHIYFAEKTMGTRRSNSELVEKLSSFCGFDKAEEDRIDRSYLLLCVIIEDDQTEIDALFDKHKVPPLATDSELAAEEEGLKRLEAKPFQNHTNTGVGSTLTDQPATVGQTIAVTPPKTNASYMTIAALAEKILLQQIKVFTVSGDVAAQGSSSDWVMFARNMQGSSSSASRSPSYMLDADISPPLGPNNVPSMENIQLISLKLSMRNHDLDRLQGLGEVFVHKILQTKILGSGYSPNHHWTSRHRTNQGYTPLSFEGPHPTTAAFTLSCYPASSAFTTFLTKITKTVSENWITKPPTYHLEVKTTAGGLLEEFKMSHGEFVRARRYRIPDYGYPTDVDVLVRVWNVEGGSGGPQMTIFVDTWAWYVSGRVMMQAVDGFRAHVRSL